MPRKKSSHKKKSVESSDRQEPRVIDLQVRSLPIFPGSVKNGSEFNVRLQRQTLYPSRIWVINDFLTSSECDAWVSHARRVGFENVSHPESWDTAFRDNDRIENLDAGTAARIWSRLSPFIPDDLHSGLPVGCYNKIRLYRYGAGQRFGKHIDESNQLDKNTSTGITVLIYLNGEGLKGGETVFYKDHDGRYVAATFKPRRGSLLFHGHGEQCLTHEASEVTEGEKFVLRTDVVYDSSTR